LTGSVPIPVFLLFGPTASGKTGILEELFTGDAPCAGEVVSADSMQVYRGMDIGTAKPSRELRTRLPHHLIDIRDPHEQFNAGEFVRLADEVIPDIARRGKLPVISGGTGFYLSNFALGLPAAPPSDTAVRAVLREELKTRGPAALVEELALRDPKSAARIHPHDEYRLLRALEVCRVSGRPLSDYPRPEYAPPGGPEHPGAGGFRKQYRLLLVGLSRDREETYRRIDQRCAQMFRQGLPEEVRKLRERGYGPGDPGMKAIGYREFFVKTGDCGYGLSADLAGVQGLIARNSRRYAKRQITYFASLPEVTWISGTGNPADRIRKLLERFLGEGAHGFRQAR
jgi:tRNA dimethylallyltransferase